MTDRQIDVERIFHAARGIPDEQNRAEYLDQICAPDQALRQHVEALLEVHEKQQDSLKSKGRANPRQSLIGRRSPKLRVSRSVATSYCRRSAKAVYMAEQEAPVRRKVVLKIIKLGMDTKQVIARFEAERQTLAMMEHANIAKVYDTGATESCRPYFVTELVKGISITEYCDQNNLTTQQRFLLFLDVCHAIHHAHQKGIVHRARSEAGQRAGDNG